MATPHVRAWYRRLLRAAVRGFPAVRDGNRYAVSQVRAGFRRPAPQMTASVLDDVCRPKLELLELSNPRRPQPPVVDIPYDPLAATAGNAPPPPPPLRPHSHHHPPPRQPTPTPAVRTPPLLLTLIGPDARPLGAAPSSSPSAATAAASAVPTSAPTAPAPVPVASAPPAPAAAAPVAAPAPVAQRPAVRTSSSPLPKATSRRPLDAVAPASATPGSAAPTPAPTPSSVPPSTASPSPAATATVAARTAATEPADGPRPYIEVAKSRPFSLFNQDASQAGAPVRPASATWATATSDVRFNYWRASYEHLRSPQPSKPQGAPGPTRRTAQKM